MLRHLLRISVSAVVAYTAASVAVAVAIMVEGNASFFSHVIEPVAIDLIISACLLPSILLFLILRIWRSCRWCSHVGFFLTFADLEAVVICVATTPGEGQDLMQFAAPKFAIGAVAAYFTAWAVDRRFPEPIAPGLCRRCRDDAHAPGHRPPECGMVVPEDVERRPIS